MKGQLIKFFTYLLNIPSRDARNYNVHAVIKFVSHFRKLLLSYCFLFDSAVRPLLMEGEAHKLTPLCSSSLRCLMKSN